MQYRQQTQTGFPIPGFPTVPGFPGGNIINRLDRLERQVNRLDRQVDRLNRRLDRIERRLGLFGDTF